MACIFITQLLSISGLACKDIIACGDATAGEYNLLMKVRDPSRPGLQVLCRVPQNYSYTYHHPWMGANITFQTNHSYIGVTSKDDIPPSIVKSGMVLTDAGLAFGDADSQSRWINPTRFAWDDFDWIRYACEQANTTSQAVSLLTHDAIDRLHATGVSENLLVVGPEDGYFIEADAFRYTIKTIDDGVDVISNYPRDLWKTQIVRCLPKAISFDAETNQTVEIGDTIRLTSLYGLKIVDKSKEAIQVRQVPFYSFFVYIDGKKKIITEPITVPLHQRTTVGDYSITLMNITSTLATVRVETIERAWQDTLFDIIDERYGTITVHDMMNWSRLQRKDMDGLRPLCEPSFRYEGVAIYSIPTVHYDVLSGGWFSASHAYATIYVPFHNCNTKVFDVYENGQAAMIAQNLSFAYNDSLLFLIENVEEVLRFENNRLETLLFKKNFSHSTIEALVTESDCSMQQLAWITHQHLHNISMSIQENQRDMLFEVTAQLWNHSYIHSIESMKHIITNLSKSLTSERIYSYIIDLCVFIAKHRLTSCQILDYSNLLAEQTFTEALTLLHSHQFNEGITKLLLAITLCESLIFQE